MLDTNMKNKGLGKERGDIKKMNVRSFVVAL